MKSDRPSSPTNVVGHGRVDLLLDAGATPAFIYDLRSVNTTARLTRAICDEASCELLYSVKACSVPAVLNTLRHTVDGFSVSSIAEALLVRSICDLPIHFTSPAVQEHDVGTLRGLASCLSFNSLNQWSRFRSRFRGTNDCSLRINPERSFGIDSRYDPCRTNSKLGIPLSHFDTDCLSSFGSDYPEGIHFHNNCDSEDLSEMTSTIHAVAESPCRKLLESAKWINLGGGYDIAHASHVDSFVASAGLLQAQFAVTTLVEPGAGLVRSSGYLVSTVVDILDYGALQIAILDTTVNHWPEVFEYQFEPDVYGHRDGAPHTYQLAGCSCLAGDVFGVYSFEKRLEIGSRVVFENAGAYSIVKANMFNGIDLPSIYVRTESGELVLQKEFGYEDFLMRCGVNTDAAV